MSKALLLQQGALVVLAVVYFIGVSVFSFSIGN